MKRQMQKSRVINYSTEEKTKSTQYWWRSYDDTTPFISALGQRFHKLTICIMNWTAQLFQNPKDLHRWIHHDNLFKKTCIVYMPGFEYFPARPSWKHPLPLWKKKEKENTSEAGYNYIQTTRWTWAYNHIVLQ